jgi:hypothetical protein
VRWQGSVSPSPRFGGNLTERKCHAKILIAIPALLSLAAGGTGLARAMSDAVSDPPRSYPVCSKAVQDECINPSQVKAAGAAQRRLICAR